MKSRIAFVVFVLVLLAVLLSASAPAQERLPNKIIPYNHNSRFCLESGFCWHERILFVGTPYLGAGGWEEYIKVTSCEYWIIPVNCLDKYIYYWERNIPVAEETYFPQMTWNQGSVFAESYDPWTKTFYPYVSYTPWVERLLGIEPEAYP